MSIQSRREFKRFRKYTLNLLERRQQIQKEEEASTQPEKSQNSRIYKRRILRRAEDT